MATELKKLQEMRVKMGHSSDGRILQERLDKYNKAVSSSELSADKKQKLFMMGKRAAKQRIKYFKRQDKRY